jgi:uncharacterized protein involved in exopolysaccharide biosynthesis
MILTLTPSRDDLRWRFAVYWARITVHKRLVLVLTICGALAGVLRTAATPPVYAARVLIRIDSPEPGCGGFSSTPARPLPVRVASEIDAAAVWLQLPSPKLEERVSKWVHKK